MFQFLLHWDLQVITFWITFYVIYLNKDGNWFCGFISDLFACHWSVTKSGIHLSCGHLELMNFRKDYNQWVKILHLFQNENHSFHVRMSPNEISLTGNRLRSDRMFKVRLSEMWLNPTFNWYLFNLN